MIKRGLIYSLLLFLIYWSPYKVYGKSSEEDLETKEELALIKTFSKAEVYFSTVPNLDIDSKGNVYAVSNREHMVYKFSPEGKLLLKFGRQGQGPGDFQWPYYFCVEKQTGRVLVIDNIGVSIFSEDGNFIRRIRTFSRVHSICATKENFVLLQPDEKYLINIFDYNGQPLISFKKKYQVDYSKFKNLSSRIVDNIVNRGFLCTDQTNIYFVSSLFGDIYSFDFSGKVLLQNKLDDLKGIQKNERIFFRTGMSRNPDGSYNVPISIKASCLFKDKIYLLLNSYGLKANYDQSINEIWQLSKNNLEIEKKFLFSAENKTNFHLCVNSLDTYGKLFYIAFYDRDMGEIIIGVYKKEENL